MPRKQNFKVTSFIVENGARSPMSNSQNSILSSNSTATTGYGGFGSPDTCKDVESLLSRKGVKDDSTKVKMAWMCAAVLGLGALSFILCFAYLPALQNLAPHNTRNVKYMDNGHSKNRTGKFRVYPDMMEEDSGIYYLGRSSFIRNSYFINVSDDSVANKSVHTLTKVLKDYPLELADGNLPDPYVRCYLDSPKPERPCFFNPAWLGEECTIHNYFGYEDNGDMINPCFLLRLEETLDWKPELFLYNEVGDWKEVYDPAFLSVYCKQQEKAVAIANGQTPGKIDRIDLLPRKGFAISFFPASKFQKDLYRAPMVMVQVRGLAQGDAVTLECGLRTKNSVELEDMGRVTIRIAYGLPKYDTAASLQSAVTTITPMESGSENTAR